MQATTLAGDQFEMANRQRSLSRGAQAQVLAFLSVRVEEVKAVRRLEPVERRRRSVRLIARRNIEVGWGEE